MDIIEKWVKITGGDNVRINDTEYRSRTDIQVRWEIIVHIDTWLDYYFQHDVINMLDEILST